MSTSLRVLNVGVLALQGAFEEHIDMLKKISVTNSDGQPLSVHAFAIRLPEQLENAHALVIPGGESTTIGKIAVRWGLVSLSRDITLH
jgi:5'-phosphate synthase pdxT subunit